MDPKVAFLTSWQNKFGEHEKTIALFGRSPRKCLLTPTEGTLAQQ